MTTPAPIPENDPPKTEKAKDPPSLIPPEILEKLPAKERQTIDRFMASAMSFGPMPNPIAQKVTAEHIAKFIDAQSEDTRLGYDDQKDSRRYTLMGFAIAGVLSVTVIITLALSNRSELLMELVKAGLFISGGLGGGFGLSEWRRRKDD